MKPSTAVFIAMIFREFESALISVFISISCLACTITTTKVKNPILIKDSKSLSRDVNSVITSQEINVDGVESITNGKSTSELTINLINPENLSADSSANNTILKHVAILVKQALRDTAEYMRYTVRFVNRTKAGDVTRTTSTGKTFESEEVKPYFYSVTLGDRFDPLTFDAAGKSIFSRADSEVVSSLTYYDHSANLSRTAENL